MASFDYRSNHLLAAMPPETLRRWCPQLQPVDMPIGMVVYEPGQAIQHVYFPLNALVSLLHVLEDGDMAEIAITGRDGVVGISCFMGGGAGSSRGVVQSAGRALRLCTSALLEEFDRSGEARHLLLRYTQALIAQMTQTAVCNRHHTIEQQLCRWLLSEPGPAGWRRPGDDAGADRQHAGRAPRGRHGGGRAPAARRPHPLFARAHHGAGSRSGGALQLRVLCRGEAGVRKAPAGLRDRLDHPRAHLVCVVADRRLPQQQASCDSDSPFAGRAVPGPTGPSGQHRHGDGGNMSGLQARQADPMPQRLREATPGWPS
jgi:CRP-like cAMP-binding protein